MFVELSKTTKGLVGRLPSGKLVFPDRSCVSKLKPGLIFIRKFTKSFDNYSFFDGEMASIGLPSVEQFLKEFGYEGDYKSIDSKYIRDNWNTRIEVFSGGDIQFVRHCNRNYGVSKTVSDYSEIKNGGIDLHYSFFGKYLIEDKTVTEDYHLFLHDAVCKLRFGKTLARVLCDLKQGPSFNGGNQSTTIKFYSHTIDKMVKAGFVETMRCEGIDYFIYSGSNFKNCLDLTNEEIEEAFALINRVNTAAEEAVASKIRKGKFSVRTLDLF